MPSFFKINPDNPDKEVLKNIAELVKQGSTVIYPTETFYGIGASAYREDALQKVFRSKGRDTLKPVLLLIESFSCLKKVAVDIPEKALILAEKFWPGPLTMLFKASPSLSPLLTGNDGKTGCRISSNKVAGMLLKSLSAPLTSTSANIAGGIPAACTEDIPEELLSMVDVVIDAGKTPGGLPSTIIDASTFPIRTVRKGAVDEKQIVSFLSMC